MTPISKLLASLTPLADGLGFRVNATDDWRQGRTLYGGIAAALCMAAVERAFPDLAPLRSAQISFVGPAVGAVRLRPERLRQGKSVGFYGCDLLGEEGGVATRAVFCFGAARESAHTRRAVVAPADIPPPDACTPYPGGFGPAFRQHFDMHHAKGSWPMSGGEPDFWLWARHNDPNAPVGAAAVLALADAPPPALFGALSAPAVISSMTWMLDVLDADALSVPGWKLLRSTADTIAEGYSAQDMRLWGEDGRALIAGRQSIAMFA